MLYFNKLTGGQIMETQELCYMRFRYFSLYIYNTLLFGVHKSISEDVGLHLGFISIYW